MYLTRGQAAQALQEDMHCKYVQLVCTANEGNRLSTASMFRGLWARGYIPKLCAASMCSALWATGLAL